MIVRFMKARKTMKINDLQVDIVKYCNNFKPQPNHIKQRIEALIEQEYIERDVHDRTKLIYRP